MKNDTNLSLHPFILLTLDLPDLINNQSSQVFSSHANNVGLGANLNVATSKFKIITKKNKNTECNVNNLTHLNGIVPAGKYWFKVNKRNTRTRCEICSKLLK